MMAALNCKPNWATLLTISSGILILSISLSYVILTTKTEENPSVSSVFDQMTAFGNCLKSCLVKFCRNSAAAVPSRRFLSAVTTTTTASYNTRKTDSKMLRFLNQEEAIKVDEELFNEYKFSVDQLMELAGLSVASAIATVYTFKKDQKVLVIAGPGNNGGDGMVAARHLKMFGFSDVTLLSARKPTKDLLVNLIRQAERTEVNITYDATQFQTDPSLGLVVDGLFGFSFKPPVRPDYQHLMSILTHAHSRKIPVVAIDIPSGWDVEKGPPSEEDQSLYFMPDTLVSLTAPKLCAKFFTGPNHYLGGRFVPKELEQKYSMNLPPYPGIECIVRL